MGNLKPKEKASEKKTHLCDVLNEVLAEGESAAYEPHGDHMVGQRHDVLVEPDRDGRKELVTVSLCMWDYTHTRGCVFVCVCALTWKGWCRVARWRTR